ncbi:hypothetical protein PPMP20_04585 [Paraburkholderia phymatum]|uniref:hypothetical protein n=1 Tax=Paraburkholderia phymatum TaxID=148447 RepID=UPI00030E47D5|nr:hypothetical protein [Paraburkholderia phymatum]
MFEYGNADAILDVLLFRAEPNKLGHTALDDFEHMCSVTGCPKNDKWAKLAFVWEWTARGRD